MASTQQSTTPTTSRYATERLAALYARVSHLEEVIEAVSANPLPSEEEQRKQVRMKLLSALVDTFRSTLLCVPETTDEQLDYWLPEIEKHEAAQPESEGQG